jgi:hypothetical protein
MITFADENQNQISGQTQCQMILEWMKSGKSISGLEALNHLKCFRLASRINDLKNQGYEICDKWVRLPSKKKVKFYYLKSEQKELFS